MKPTFEEMLPEEIGELFQKIAGKIDRLLGGNKAFVLVVNATHTVSNLKEDRYINELLKDYLDNYRAQCIENN